VRTLLAGTKSQTRRAIKPQPSPSSTEAFVGADGVWRFSHPTARGPVSHEADDVRCPYGAPGERLWVREAFIHEPADYCWEASVSIPSRPASTVYRADFPDSQPGEGWKPSIHMPRKLSRILLEITDVRVERLQEISQADALAEGIEPMRCPDCHLASYGLPGWGHDQLNPTAQGAYRYLWESINGDGSWDLNPWVWAVSFRRIEPIAWRAA
jgi:hypothetical protein